MKPEWIEIPEKKCASGVLCVGEAAKEIPFPIARFFFIHQIPKNATRGGHSLQQSKEAIFCLQDSCTLWLFQPDGTEHRFDLDQSFRGVYIPTGFWVELGNFRPGTILLALASEPYDPSEYIREPESFFHAPPYPDPVLRPRF